MRQIQSIPIIVAKTNTDGSCKTFLAQANLTEPSLALIAFVLELYKFLQALGFVRAQPYFQTAPNTSKSSGESRFVLPLLLGTNSFPGAKNATKLHTNFDDFLVFDPFIKQHKQCKVPLRNFDNTPSKTYFLLASV